MSLDDFENFREKNGDSCDDDEEEYFPVCREKNSWESEHGCKEIYHESDLGFWESDFEESKMQMRILISLHRILSAPDATDDNIDQIDEVYSQNRYGCRDFSSCDNGKGCN